MKGDCSETEHTSSKGMPGAGTMRNSFTHLNLPATLFPEAIIVIIGNGIRNDSGGWLDTNTQWHLLMASCQAMK